MNVENVENVEKMVVQEPNYFLYFFGTGALLFFGLLIYNWLTRIDFITQRVS